MKAIRIDKCYRIYTFPFAATYQIYLGTGTRATCTF